MLIILAAVANNGVIGNKGVTPWNIPEEMALFKTITTGNTVIMGRKTYESIGHALPNRNNIVLSKTLPEQTSNNLVICPSLEQALSYITKEQKTFVIGGGQIYAQLMPLADEMRISHIKADYPGDTFFPEITSTIWKNISSVEYKDFIHSTYIRT